MKKWSDWTIARPAPSGPVGVPSFPTIILQLRLQTIVLVAFSTIHVGTGVCHPEKCFYFKTYCIRPKILKLENYLKNTYQIYTHISFAGWKVYNVKNFDMVHFFPKPILCMDANVSMNRLYLTSHQKALHYMYSETGRFLSSTYELFFHNFIKWSTLK